MTEVIFYKQMWGADSCPPANGASCKFNELHDKLLAAGKPPRGVREESLENGSFPSNNNDYKGHPDAVKIRRGCNNKK